MAVGKKSLLDSQLRVFLGLKCGVRKADFVSIEPTLVIARGIRQSRESFGVEGRPQKSSPLLDWLGLTVWKMCVETSCCGYSGGCGSVSQGFGKCEISCCWFHLQPSTGSLPYLLPLLSSFIPCKWIQNNLQLLEGRKWP